MVRSAYGIGELEGHYGFSDCCVPMMCICCAINQLYQTTSKYGRAPGGYVGPEFNTSPMSPMENTQPHSLLSSILIAYCCAPCGLGKILHEAIGMPFLLGCMCSNICFGRSILRYHYRIKPTSSNECMDECGAPTIQKILECTVGIFVPCLCPMFAAAEIAVHMQMENEVDVRGKAEGHRYLYGFKPKQHLQQQQESANSAIRGGGSNVSSTSNPLVAPPPPPVPPPPAKEVAMT